MPFFKNILRSSSKHKKLSEECALAKNNLDNTSQLEFCDTNELDNGLVTFDLKYLGSTLVERETNETVTAEAIKTILRVAKAAGKKLKHVEVAVTHNGIRATDKEIEKDILDISIYRISYCSADASNSRVFAFNASNQNGTIECHAFLCRKRKLAQAVTLSVARAFSMAYEAWRVLPTSSKHEEATQAFNPHQLIDLGGADSEILQPGFNKNEWVSFDDDAESQRWCGNQEQINLILN